MRLVLLGAPGSGKGVQAKKLCERFNIPHISSGDIFREEIAKKSPLGLEVEAHVSSGRLVPDSLVMQTMLARLERPDCVEGFLLDGFPRTVTQAEQLETYLDRKGNRLNGAFYLNVAVEILLKRLTARRHCGSCGKVYNLVSQPPRQAGSCDSCGSQLQQRSDDNVITVQRRLTVYQDLTEPLVVYYRSRGILTEADGSQDPETVAASIFSALDQQKAKR